MLYCGGSKWRYPLWGNLQLGPTFPFSPKAWRDNNMSRRYTKVLKWIRPMSLWESFDFFWKCFKDHDGGRMWEGLARHNQWDTKKFNTMTQSKPKELKTNEDKRYLWWLYKGLDCIALKKPDGYIGKNMYYPHQGIMILYEDPRKVCATRLPMGWIHKEKKICII